MYYLPVVKHMKAKTQVVKFRLGRGDLQRGDSLSLLFDLTSVPLTSGMETHIKHSSIHCLLCDITIMFYCL